MADTITGKQAPDKYQSWLRCNFRHWARHARCRILPTESCHEIELRRCRCYERRRSILLAWSAKDCTRYIPQLLAKLPSWSPWMGKLHGQSKAQYQHSPDVLNVLDMTVMRKTVSLYQQNGIACFDRLLYRTAER